MKSYLHRHRWLALLLAAWIGSAGWAAASGPVANNQTNSTAVLSQEYGISLSYTNPGDGTVTFRLLEASAGTLGFRDQDLSDALPITTNTVVDTSCGSHAGRCLSGPHFLLRRRPRAALARQSGQRRRHTGRHRGRKIYIHRDVVQAAGVKTEDDPESIST